MTMTANSQQRYHARVASGPRDIERAQRLRYSAFLAGRDLAGRDDDEDLAKPEGIESDSFDDLCTHMLVEEVATGRLVCCFRLLPLARGEEITRSYSAQFYELSALSRFDAPMVEMGRFCMAPDCHDPDVLRVAWGAMTRFVDDNGVEMLFGCSSFRGTDAEAYLDAFAMLKDRHLAPRRWLPRVKAPSVFRFAHKLRRRQPDLKQAMKRMPPLLRTYLLMGGWVSDHAVVDRQMNTLHVFTGVEISAIPHARRRLLRAAAQ